ncbi:2-hydroxyacid dehydrogenase [Cronobacter sakazakii]|uniref:2-hydroxyacid dehydrogenase n=1 Tax=Cronobacter sakazakii TaxID=28141 RepID=UPI000BE7A275|nr:2-hydroxyacid dehydrogenase [Cronobacter sakazakii]EKC6209202.1 2-hydroxyacid dehydrogenase [Cronobacter sakazakii]EKD3164071.1 2-hydroxyacid dehydrogenase [Cronobacter sakazakii]EKD3183567.1 2-hydroxyacid dehydrogenase [Cronobacter sakazakii]EKD3192811.1 2-hydroxyacid dehydrogenase [Cronobacter sakazakii]EKD3202166.1 2-hydroxyacid dehydrogenase [Cronobacter sakazakii]
MKPMVLKHAYLPDALTTGLRARYDLREFSQMSDADFVAIAGDITALVTNGEAVVTGEFIARLPALSLIAVFGVGYDGVDVATARERGIAVTHTPGVLTDDVADLAIGLMLATSRRIVAAQKFIEQGGWQQGGFTWTRKVSGARLGIFGMGRIGQAIARRAQAFDMEIRYTSRQPHSALPYRFVPGLAQLARESDFLMLCAPGGDATRGVVNAAVLEALGPQGILINVARGSVVDETALIAALESGTIAGAGLDVFTDEPNVPAPLQQRDNVVITPHMASATWETRREMSRLVLENINAWCAGEPLITPVP